MRYQFSRLSSLDFEELVHDLLAADWQTNLETFKGGKDGGIDLRHIAIDGGATIVQCKEYETSGFSSLYSHMKRKELAKVRALNPTRYVLVTSVPLSALNKKALTDLLEPFVQKTADVIGGKELEALLRKHESVEKSHYKLWLTSIPVLQKVLHAAEQCQTDIEIEKIQRKLPIFVQNEAYPRALDILLQSHVLIISGAPGIGKSTLAEMLIYAHLEQGYEPVAIKSDLAEGRKFYRPDRKLLFYFDDFLGQTYLGDRPEYLGQNKDASLADFMELMRGSERSRFILTTREHILGGALNRSEKLANSQIGNHRCIIELADYRRSQKARILYNHLYFSALPSKYKKAIVKNDFFLKVIDHPNFNPRVIEWLSTYARVKSVPPEDYADHVKKLLDEPERIWAHAFDIEISDAARALLIAKYTIGFNSALEDVEAAFNHLHRHSSKKYNYSTTPNDFRATLKELDGSFINIQKGIVEFINPSVRDFLSRVLASSSNRVQDVVETAIRSRQIANLWRLAKEDTRFFELRNNLLADRALFFSSLTRLISGPDIRWTKSEHGMSGTFIDYSHLGRARFAVELVEELKSSDSIKYARAAFDFYFSHVEGHWLEVSEVTGLISSLESSGWFLENGGTEQRNKLISLIMDRLDEARSSEWQAILELPDGTLNEEDSRKVDAALERYRTDTVADERYDCNTIEEMEGLKDTLESFERKYGIDFKQQIELLEEKIGESSAPDPDSGGVTFPRAALDVESPMGDEAIRDMFSAFVGD